MDDDVDDNNNTVMRIFLILIQRNYHLHNEIKQKVIYLYYTINNYFLNDQINRLTCDANNLGRIK